MESHLLIARIHLFAQSIFLGTQQIFNSLTANVILDANFVATHHFMTATK